MSMSRLSHVLQITPIGVAATAAAAATEDAKPESLESFLNTLPSLIGQNNLRTLLLSLADATREIGSILRSMNVSTMSTSNTFGDQQLNVDLATHHTVLKYLRQSGVCVTASSEEDPIHIDLSESLRNTKQASSDEQVFSVGFDPLDGSSIIDANFAVGSIFSIFPGRELLGQRVSNQRAAAIAQYGPRTTIIFALPPNIVFEATLITHDDDTNSWFISQPSIKIKPTTKIFAPANLRCTTEDAAYKRLVQYYMDNKYTLRYSGGLVPDAYHILKKSNGIFLSPVSKSNKAKLRLVYECASLSMIIHCAGGAAVNERCESMLDQVLSHYDVRSGLIIGSIKEVERYKQFHGEGQK